jgi:DNA primase
MSTVEFHPWNSRRADTERPDEWRIDLDPMPECGFDTVRVVAGVVQELLAELGITGYPKTSGGRGLHVYVRIRPDWEFGLVRRAALAFAREVERRAPDVVTTTWWRKDRDPRTLFVDYNQNARDHTIATVPARFAELGDLHEGIDDVAHSLETLLEWAERDGVEEPDESAGA